MAVADHIDPQLVTGLRKARQGTPLTLREQRAVDKYEQALREKHGSAYVRALPKKDVVAELGLSNKTLLEWVDRFGMPWEPHAKTVDGFALLRWATGLIRDCSQPILRHLTTLRNKDAVHEFLPDLDDDSNRDWRDECFKEKAKALRDERLVREKKLIPAETVTAFADRIAKGVREATEKLGQKFGKDATEIMHDMWGNVETDVLGLLEAGDDPSREA